jgi:ADP-ribose pyrophosphatase
MQKFSKSDVSLLKKEVVYKGFFRVNKYILQHQKFDGGQTKSLTRECFERGHAVGVLAYDPWLDNVLLLEQFRIGAYVSNNSNSSNKRGNSFVTEQQSPWLLEIIAGIVEQGETPEEVAHREAYEEAGCKLLAFESIGHFFSSPGGSSETTQLYCACVQTDGLGGIHGLQEEGEDIRVRVISYDEMTQWYNEGLLNNASTMISVQWLMLKRNHLKRKWQESVKI